MTNQQHPIIEERSDGRVYLNDSPLLLPGRSIEELLGRTFEIRRAPHRCTGKNDCPNDSHKPVKGVYVRDERPTSPYASRHENGGVWAMTYCDPHPDIKKEWERVNGPLNDKWCGLGCLRIIRWPSGTLLVGEFTGAGSCWITFEKARHE